MSEKKREVRYCILKIISIIVSCALPIFAVCEHFPIWKTSHGTVRSIGVGGIICLIVILVVFRKAVFSFIEKRLRLENAPPMAIWMVLLIISYVLKFINSFIQDLTTVFWMGFVGCAIGTLITFIAEHKFGKKEGKKEEKDERT